MIDKDELVSLLKESLSRADAFCKERGINLETILTVEPLEKIKLLDDAVEAIIVNDESKKQYITLSTTLWRLYKAVLPAPKANELAPMVILHHVIAKKITSLAPPADISEVMDKVEKLLDESIEADGYLIQESGEDDPYVDLSAIDFDALKDKFSKGKKRTEAEKLKGAINSKLKAMVRLNPSRMDYLKKFQEMIDEYNNGAINVEELFSRFLRFTDELNEEEKRHISEQLTEEELSVFDILSKPEMDITEKERKQLKKIAHDLLETLRREKLVLDWRKHQTPRAAVRVAIEDELDQLPECYGKVYQQKCDAVYQHVYECYYGEERSVYS